MKSISIYIVLSFQVIISIQWVFVNERCITPDGRAGNCVVITECKSITDYILESQGLTRPQLTLLDKYKCGYSGKILKMCCLEGSLIVNKTQESLSTSTQSSSTFSSNTHKNAKLLPFECGLNELRDKLVFGKKTSINEFPWIALLAYQSNNGSIFKCGGTIINERYILTAAHCINKQLFSVRVGEYNIATEEDCETDRNKTTECAFPVQNIRIEKKIVHNKYISALYQNDIALLRLSKPLNISAENTKAICLPVQNNLVSEEVPLTRLLLTGWGLTEKGFISDVLLKSEVPIADKELCGIIYEKYGITISDKQFCVGGLGSNNTDACNGDSGGPLHTLNFFNNDVRFIQYGIISLGPKMCGRRRIPTVNTRVDKYIDWILDNIQP